MIKQLSNQRNSKKKK